MSRLWEPQFITFVLVWDRQVVSPGTLSLSHTHSLFHTHIAAECVRVCEGEGTSRSIGRLPYYFFSSLLLSSLELSDTQVYEP